jgi:hypothetical protein
MPPITATSCRSRIESSTVLAACSRAGRPVSSTETKFTRYSPARPPACASASFSPSTMSRDVPRPGSGSDEYTASVVPTTAPPRTIFTFEPQPASASASPASTSARRTQPSSRTVSVGTPASSQCSRRMVSSTAGPG